MTQDRAIRRSVPLPTRREWIRHAALFLLTALTATLAGVMLITADAIDPPMPDPVRWTDYALYVPVYYFKAVGALLAHTAAHPQLIAQGAAFAISLLIILTAHEAGHYLACRRYGVAATLPFFIPAPPLFLAGTFGAFIKIKSPIPSRRALFDIGVAGPLAGFIVIIPVAIVALLTAQPHAAPPTGSVIYFNDPLLLRLMARALGVSLPDLAPNPFYFAAWVGLIVTSLNLLPVGQLDGGHATYAIFGARLHKSIGKVAFIAMCAFAALGWFWHRAPSGILYVVLLFIMLRVRHPEAENEAEKLGSARLVVALLTLIVFLFSFWPFPVTIT